MRSTYTGVLIIKRDEIIRNRSIFSEIEERRRTKGMSISEMCRRSGVSRHTYYKWRAGGGIMPETLAQIRRTLSL